MNQTEQIAKEVEALRRPDGLILAEDVVAWAQSNPDSALHSQFEWDNSEAAKQYRIWQARRVIAVCVRADDGARKLVSLSIDRTSGGYRSVDDVISNDELRRILVNDALAEFKRVRAKYQHVKELVSVYEEIDKAEKQYGPHSQESAHAA